MDTTTLHPEFLFHQTAAQVRRSGARGGRATARNRRARSNEPLRDEALVILHERGQKCDGK